MLDEASLWFDGQVEPYMEQELKTTINKLARLEPFEEKLVSVSLVVLPVRVLLVIELPG